MNLNAGLVIGNQSKWRDNEMRLKPAGIKTVREAIERLMNGEVFYDRTGQRKMFYDDSFISCSDGYVSPFKRLYLGNGQTSHINIFWSDVENWLIENRWEDNIGVGVMCWVSLYIKNPDYTCPMRVIVGYDKNSAQYTAIEGTHWLYAIPVGEEIEKFLLKNR